MQTSRNVKSRTAAACRRRSANRLLYVGLASIFQRFTQPLGTKTLQNCENQEMDTLDKLDRQILRMLQADGRATYDQIAEQVSLSPSAVLRRVKRLEASGVIDSYVALVRPESVGLVLTAYLNVRLEKHTESHKRNPMDAFRASVQTWPEVVECASLTGEMDYLLRVLVEDMAHYSRFIMDTLLKHPSVQDCKTSFVLDRVKATTAVPV